MKYYETVQRCRFLIIQLKYYETLYRYHFSHNLVEVLRNFIVVVIMPRYCKYLMQLFAKTFYKRIILQQCLLFNFRRLHQEKSVASKFFTPKFFAFVFFSRRFFLIHIWYLQKTKATIWRKLFYWKNWSNSMCVLI